MEAKKRGRPSKADIAKRESEEKKKAKQEEVMPYHPKNIVGMMEGTADEILAFMLNNSGLDKEKYRAMMGITWETALKSLEGVETILRTLRMLGYKMVAIPVANYMLSDVEAYQFIAQSDKITALDEIEVETVNFKPMSMAELRAYGIEFAKRTSLQQLIYEKAQDEDAIAESGLIRSIEGWKFRPSPKKRKYYCQPRKVDPQSLHQVKLREKEYRRNGRPKAKEPDRDRLIIRTNISEADRLESDMFYGKGLNIMEKNI